MLRSISKQSGKCLYIFKISEHLAKLQARTSLFMHFVHLPNALLKDEKVHETTTFLLVTLPNIHQFFFKFSLADSAITFLNLIINNPTTP